MADRIELTNMVFNNAKFINFPSHVDDEDNITYNLMYAAVAEWITEQFSQEIKLAVTVGWAKLDVESLVQSAETIQKLKDHLSLKKKPLLPNRNCFSNYIGEGYSIKNY